MSDVCELFGCTPDIAIRQDLSLVEAIADYRAARAARDAMNHQDRKRGFEILRDNPGLMRVMAYMARAQQGKPLDAPALEQEGMGVAEANRAVPEDDDDGG